MAALHLRAGTRVTEEPKTFSGDLAHLPPIVAAAHPAKAFDQCRRRSSREGKNGKEEWTKPPRLTRVPAYSARSNDPDTCGSYDDTVAAVAAGDADGIGYMLLGSGVGAIDLDHVVARGWHCSLGGTATDRAAAACQERTRQRRRLAGSSAKRLRPGHSSQIHLPSPEPTPASNSTETRHATSLSRDLSSSDCVALPSIDDLIDTLLAQAQRRTPRAPKTTRSISNATERQKLFDYDALIRTGLRKASVARPSPPSFGAWPARVGRPSRWIEELSQTPGGIGAK